MAFTLKTSNWLDRPRDGYITKAGGSVQTSLRRPFCILVPVFTREEYLQKDDDLRSKRKTRVFNKTLSIHLRHVNNVNPCVTCSLQAVHYIKLISYKS